MFYGLPLDGAQESVVPLIRDVVDATQGKPVPAANLHATLAFVGAVSRDVIGDLVRIGTELPRTPIALALDTIGSFRGARVAWIGPSRLAPSLTALHQALDGCLRDAGFPVETRAYHPHVTLARHCRRVVAERTIDPLPWSVQRIVLDELIGAEGGPRYEPCAQWPLRAG